MLTILKKYILKLYPYQGHRLNDLKPDKKSKKKLRHTVDIIHYIALDTL